MTMDKKYLVLEIDAGKVEELAQALSKRPYIKILSLSREDRERLEACPACGRKFSREVVVTVNAEMLTFLVQMLRRLKVAKSVVLVNKRNPIDTVMVPDRERAVAFPHPLIEKAELLSLIKKFDDGSTETYFITKKGLSFLSGREPLKPSRYIVSDGKVLEMSGQLDINDVKFSDRVDHDKLMREAKKAVLDLPDKVVQFIQSGQIPLM